MPDAPTSSTPDARTISEPPAPELAEAEDAERRPPVVVGWVQAGSLDGGQREAFKPSDTIIAWSRAQTGRTR